MKMLSLFSVFRLPGGGEGSCSCLTQSVLDITGLQIYKNTERGIRYTAVQSECEKHCRVWNYK